ncbi:MAG TPA: hypothetical protein V6C65_08585 [Allocoleopsis sp.]
MNIERVPARSVKGNLYCKPLNPAMVVLPDGESVQKVVKLRTDPRDALPALREVVYDRSYAVDLIRHYLGGLSNLPQEQLQSLINDALGKG